MTDLVVTVTPGADVHEVADRLAGLGFKVRDKLEAVGCIIGSAASDLVPQLGTVDGVASVEADVNIQLPPPGSPIT